MNLKTVYQHCLCILYTCPNNERGSLYAKGKVGVNVMIYHALTAALSACAYKADTKNIVIVLYFRLRWIFLYLYFLGYSSLQETVKIHNPPPPPEVGDLTLYIFLWSIGRHMNVLDKNWPGKKTHGLVKRNGCMAAN